MNILFVCSVKDARDSIKPLKNQTAIHFGISYISSVLKVHKHQTELLVLTYNTPKSFIDETIGKFAPEVICFTAVASEYEFIRECAHYIKAKYPHIYLVAGGVHVSLNAEEVIRDGFDAICIGEGEYPVLELVQQLEKDNKVTGIANLWIKHGETIEKNPARTFLQDLDSLPFPDRDIWQKWVKGSNTKHMILLGRGCPFQCTYCCNHALVKLAPGKYVRFRSPDNVIKELDAIMQRFPKTEEIYFEVETIGVNMHFATDLCTQLSAFNAKLSKPLTFGVNLRITPNMDYDPLFQEFRRANFRYVKIGLESGSDRVRKDILNRYYSNADILKAVKSAQQYDLKVGMYVMVGIPGETLSDFQETIQCIRACQPQKGVGLGIFYPYPGTQLYRLCQEKGLLTHDRTARSERKIATLDLPGFSRKEIQKQYDWFPYHVYKGRSPLSFLLKQVFSRRISSLCNILNAYFCRR
ncbi:MAG: radical SAM protein [Kiritimatiellae bacterium]|nr:radical SAM protein [Kiritimatiellia bacterium]MDD5522683.1 radical SAM protein [Kiritimatiellia bacterium]